MMKLRNLLLAGVASTSLSASFIAPAIADVPGYTEYGPAWTHTASSCAMDPQQLDKAAFNNADFFFQQNAFSVPIVLRGVILGYEPIIARCNVLNPLDFDPANENPEWNALIVGYGDPDGMGINTNVVAKLIRVSRNTGAVSTVATFDSNKSNVTARTEALVSLNRPMDFRHNEYFVQLELLRTPLASHQTPVIYSVRLVSTICLTCPTQ